MRNKICPITFTYQEKTYRGFDTGYTLLSEGAYTDAGRGKRTRTLCYLHDASHTEWRVHESVYPDYGAREWQVDVVATADTDVLSDVGYELCIEGQNGRIIGNHGDAVKQYALYDMALSEGAAVFENTDGRPTHGVFPYFRVETDAAKTIAVLSWQGMWYARFAQTEAGVTMKGGQVGVSTRLLQGEVFRVPLLLLLPYESDSVNAWRRFYVDTQMPLMKGAPVPPMLSIFNGQCEGLTGERIEAAYDTYLRNGIKPDLWWCDAGWGTDGTGPHNPRDQWYMGVNFEWDYSRFPDALGGFGRRLQADGTQLLLWFEAECVRTPPEFEEGFYAYHPDFKPEFFLGTYRYEWCGLTMTARLLNLGNPEARAWLVDRVCACMDEANATVYRQDFNIPPIMVFRGADTEDRRGMAENLYCQGYLAYLDALLARYPGMLMDSCASGGGRLDLETMRRMVPLHYSDHQDVYPTDCETRIYMTQVVNHWFPYVKNSAGASALSDRYARRASFSAMISPGFPFAALEGADFATLRLLIQEWKSVNAAYLGDMYDLEIPDRSAETVKGYQYMTREGDFGFAVVLVPGECPVTEYVLRPKGLDPTRLYTVKDLNREGSILTTADGRTLMESGIALSVQARDSYLITLFAK